MTIQICDHCHQVRPCIHVGRWNLCEEHKDLKQYQQKQKKEAKIAPRSKKRAKEERDYSTVRKEYLEEHPICEVCIRENNPYKYPATEIHHKKGRIGPLLTDSRYFLAVCRDHHEFIENNPKWAKLKGYSINRLTK